MKEKSEKQSKIKYYKERFLFHYTRNKRFRILSVVTGLILSVLFVLLLSFMIVRIGNAGKVSAAISKEPDSLDPTFCADA